MWTGKEHKSEYYLPGCNAIETSFLLAEQQAAYAKTPPMIKVESAVKILRRFNEHGVRYALIGGAAMAHHAVARATQDLDIVVLSDDARRIKELFPDCYRRGTAVAGVYEFEGTRFDVQPANLRMQMAAVTNAVDGELFGLSVKVANLRDLLLLKLWAVPDRPDLGKRSQDETDIITLLQHNRDLLIADDIAYCAKQLLGISFSQQDLDKYTGMIQWLNDTLEKLGMEGLKYPLT